MKTNNFTQMLLEALSSAKSLCEERGYQEINPLIMAKILIEQSEGLVNQVITESGEKGRRFSSLIDEAVEKLPTVQGSTTNVYFSPSLEQTFNKAESLASELKDSYISTDSFFLALLENESLN